MCGIAGLIAPDGARPDDLRDRVARMTATLAHRGPDDDGRWVDPDGRVALGQRRLAVVDLSPTGAQPMRSASGRHVLVYNGELYGTEGLRRDLDAAGVRLRGSSDTEVLLEACERFGVDATLPRLVGMFAFALWDVEGRRLHLVRDRLGIKPLYLATVAGLTAFASETRALRALPGFAGGVDRDVLAAYLQRSCVPGHASIHPGVTQVRPGTWVRIDDRGRRSERTWWSLTDVVVAAADARRSPRADAEAADELEDRLRTAVTQRMVADVPLGAFLSGGIDSSTVVALMQAASDRPVRTFTVGSTERTHDESAHARAIAAHLGTDHVELVVAPDAAAARVPELLAGLDEPFADPSYVPTHLVAELAREHVTVALSGDGGDEVFGGYTRHRAAASGAGRLLGVPAPLRRLVAGAVRAVPVPAWDRAALLVPSHRRPPRPGEQAHRAAAALAARDAAALHDVLTTTWPDAERLVPGAVAPEVWGGATPPTLAPAERMMLADTLGYLPDDILTKVDRASMAVSLEARVPLLDHRVVEFAWTLPLAQRIRAGRTKWLLREVLARAVPPRLTERPKQGFDLPFGAWLRGALRPWAEELLAPAALAADGLLDPAPIRAAWADHLRGRGDHHQRLWAVLALQAWRAAGR